MVIYDLMCLYTNLSLHLLLVLYNIAPGQERMPVSHRPNSAVISATELKNIRSQLSLGKQNNSQVSVIQKQDLDRIRKEVIIKDKATLKRESTMMNEQKT